MHRYTTVLLIALFPFCVFGQTGRAVQPRDGWSGVDSSGKRFTQRVFPDRNSPFMKDVTKKPMPVYPYNDRARKNTGSGLYRMEIDLKTGLVRKVAIVRSTGHNTLDEAAVNALSKWRFRPNSWKEVTFPVVFIMAKPDGSIPSIPSSMMPMPLERGGGMRP